MSRRALIWPLLLALGCELPIALPGAPEPPKPGTLSGRLVLEQPATGKVVAAAGATVQLLGTNVTSIANEEGRFVLGPILGDEGTILFRHGDAETVRQRLSKLSQLGARFGLDLSAGDIPLRENASIEGRVLLADRASGRGHRGITVFVPEGPFTAWSGDDGSWSLPRMPEGRVTLAFFRDGYAAASAGPFELQPGQSLVVRELLLPIAPPDPEEVPVRGLVRFDPPLSDATRTEVTAHSATGQVTFEVAADGRFAGPLRPGLYELEFAYEGYGRVSLRNVLVVAGEAELVLRDVTLAAAQAPAPTDPDPVEPAPPVAAVASPPFGELGKAFVLDGSASTGTPGQPLSFDWRQLAGDPVVLDRNGAPAAVRASFVAPATPQRLAFELTVTDPATALAESVTTTIDFHPAPVARVTAPANGRAGSSLTLDATGSTGPDGHALSYAWKQTAGAPVVLDRTTGPDAARPSFIGPVTPQVIAFELTVTDTVTSLTGLAVTTIALHVPPAPHVAAPTLALAGTLVELDASGTTAPDGHGLTFSWRQSGGDAVVFTANDSPAAAVTRFRAPLTAQRIAIELTAVDSVTQLAGSTSLLVTVQVPPEARVAPVRAVRAGAVVRLDASASRAGSGGQLSYLWTQTAGEQVALGVNDSIAAATPTFAAPSTSQTLEFSLIVTDLDTGLTDGATVVVRVAVPPEPVAADVVATVGALVALDAGGTVAPGGHVLSFRWSQQSGAAVILGENDSPAAVRTTFRAPATGQELVFDLTVTDTVTGLDAARRVVVSVREPPRALIRPIGAVAAASTVRLDGSLSTTGAGGVKSYRWVQTAGESVVLSDNDSVFAGSVTFTAPARAQPLGFTLTVKDLLSGLSGDASTVIVVAEPPVARLSPASLTVAPGIAVRFDGSGSSDPLGGALTYEWSLGGSADVTVNSPDRRGSTLDLTTGTGPFLVRLVVRSSLLASAPATVAVTIDEARVLEPTLSVSPPQMVATGATVELRARADHPSPGETIAWSWRQLTGPAVTLITGLETGAESVRTFVAPADAALFSFEARAVASPSTGAATVTAYVESEDRQGPRVVSTVPAYGGGTGPWLNASVAFDEQLDPATVNESTLQLLDSASTPVPTAVRWNPLLRQATLLPRRPLTPGAAYTLRIGEVRDTSIRRNVHAAESLPFTARARRWTHWSAGAPVTFSGQAPAPAVTLAAEGVAVFARRDNPVPNCIFGVWKLGLPAAGGTLVNRTPGCWPMQTYDYYQGHNPSPPSGNVATVGLRTYVLADGWARQQVQQFQGVWTSAAYSLPTIFWAAGAVFEGLNGGYEYKRWDPTSNSVLVESIRPVTSFAMDHPAFSGGHGGGRTVVTTAQRPNSVNPPFTQYILAHERVTPGNWRLLAASGGLEVQAGSFASGLDVRTRTAFAHGEPVVGVLADNSGHSLSAFHWQPATSTWASRPVGPAESFDLVTRGDTGWFAWTVTGELRAGYLDFGTAGAALVPVPGPAGPGLNDTPGCTASRPQLAVGDDAVWLTWQESCAAGTYGVFLKRLD